MQSACWAMAKSWLDAQVDLEVTRSQTGGEDQLKTFGDVIEGSPGHTDGSFEPLDAPENWPFQVLNQQPRQVSSLLQKLHSGLLLKSYHASDVFLMLLFLKMFSFPSVLGKCSMKLLLDNARSNSDKLRYLQSNFIYHDYYS